MHEMSLCKEVMRIVEDHAAGRRVHAVCLEIGMLSHLKPETMRAYFETAAKGTPAEGARLEIRRAPGQARCPACAREAAVETIHDPCPHCGAPGLRVTGGDQVKVEELEVE